MNRLFVDTGGLVARVLPRDQYHSASLKGWGILEQVNTHLFSSEHVLDESISLLARHASAG